MCPACLTAAVMTAAGTASGAGLLGFIVARWRRLRRWLRRARQRSLGDSQACAGGCRRASTTSAKAGEDHRLA